jgi:hypothetical protein
MCRIKFELGASELSVSFALLELVILFRFLALREPYKGSGKARIIADYESVARTRCSDNSQLLLTINF